MLKVNIGKDWRPTSYERRTPTEYQCLRPVPGADAVRLQRALLHERDWIHTTPWDNIIALSCGAIIIGALVLWLN